MNHNILRFLFIVILSNISNPPGICQTEMPDVLRTGNLTEQLNYIEDRTRIYDYYRAIREDMWQQLKKNTLDTLSVARGKISTLTLSQNKYDTRIDSLNKLITDASVKLDEAVRTKNNINVLGLDVNKFAYNSFMWIILACLAAILAIGFLAFKRNIAVTRNTKKDLEELKTEFETYRKQSREAREKMSKDHFNEVRRLKAHLSSAASPASEVLMKEVKKEEGSVQKEESPGPHMKNEEVNVQGLESGSEGELQQAQSIEQRTEGEEQILQNAVRKPRRRKTQNPGQGSIEL